MQRHDEHAAQRDARDRELFAIRREERDMEVEERVLERELADFEGDLADAELEIEQELRREHFGHEPERPLAWTDDAAKRPRPR